MRELLEVILDLGRPAEARFPAGDVLLNSHEVTEDDIQYVVARIGVFGDDNRAGIERTLHRISAIRNRKGKIVGLTLRVGRAVFGMIKLIDDLVFSEKSILLLGRPGVGKTTMLREMSRVLADEARKRVVIVDTSNEIAGDGDIPHPAIGHARRMQVKTPSLQHSVMIEAVENHMPEVIIIDEMGTELEALAARTIAERGVQLVATAHGNTLENLVMNPTLSDLIGGIQTVTLGDEEARRRHTKKSILERKAPPTFEIIVEIQGWDRVAVHPNVAQAVDNMLRGVSIAPETRWVDKAGKLHRSHTTAKPLMTTLPEKALGQVTGGRITKILPFGVDRGKLQQVVRGYQAPLEVVNDLKEADLLLTTKSYYRRGPVALGEAEEAGKPVYVLRKNTLPQLEEFVRGISRSATMTEGSSDSLLTAVQEAEEAVGRVLEGETSVALTPQNSYIRLLQHRIAQRHNLGSASSGQDPHRRVVIQPR
ncbi:MAG: AAA family ATPase [Chloroflexi bacterium]|nr:AAA family ATPase [Chloroflexota bacterium]